MNRQASRLAGSLSVAVLLSVPGPVTAADRAHREHAAHEHGHGVLEVVFEGKMLAIGLRVPAVNVVGFEHAPETDAQKHAVEEAVARFRAGEKLFVLPAQAKCKATHLDVELAGMDDRAHAGHGGHEQHAKDEHGHEKASEESHAELEGSLSLDSLNIEGFGWTVHDFLQPVNIDGIDYCHYFYNPNSGRPYGGTVVNKLKHIKSSFSMGHQQGLQIHTETANNGRKLWGCVAGSFYQHSENYKGPQGNDHFQGIVMKHNVKDGDYSPCIVQLDYLMEKYL